MEGVKLLGLEARGFGGYSGGGCYVKKQNLLRRGYVKKQKCIKKTEQILNRSQRREAAQCMKFSINIDCSGTYDVD